MSDGYGDEGGGNGDGNNMRDGNGDEGCRATKRAIGRVARVMMTATKRAIVTVAKVMATAMKRAMLTVGEGNVIDGKSDGRQGRRGQGRRREEVRRRRLWWRGTKRAMETAARAMAMATKRARARAARGMATATRVAGDYEGTCGINKSNGDGDEEGDGDQQGHHGQWLHGIVATVVRCHQRWRPWQWRRLTNLFFLILMFGKEAVCPDGLFVPALFRESGVYFNSLKYS
jgi:hypothetical protein